jgi:hypothetical protein
MKKIAVLLSVVFACSAVNAEVIVRYNFKGRSAENTSVSRLKVDGKLTGNLGPDYKPNPEKGEIGPELKNFTTGKEPYYNFFYTNEDGVDYLEMKLPHPHYRSSFQSIVPEGAQPLKAFTLEIYFSVSSINGVTTGGKNTVATLFYNGQERVWFYNLDAKRGTYTLALTVGGKDIVVEALNLKSFYHVALSAAEDGKVRLFVDGEEKGVLSAPKESQRKAVFDLLGTDKLNSDIVGLVRDVVISNQPLEPKNFVVKK